MSAITVIPCLGGRLQSAYPASRHDVELRVGGVAVHDLPRVLEAASEEALQANPLCRKVVFAAPAGDLATISAAESAGFRYVIDVDIDDGGQLVELSLLVREPECITEMDRDPQA